MFRILIYPSEGDDSGRFTARCLSMDLVAVDDTVEGAVSELLETIEASLEAARKHNANVFREAPDEYWEKLANARVLPLELMERIVFNANKRHGAEDPPLIDVERQCDMRQLEVA